MKAVVQRVSEASVEIDNKIISKINEGLLVLIAFRDEDDEQTIKWIANKIANLRIFPDDENKMNRSVLDIRGAILIISNFTIYGDVHKGFRPNFMLSARPELAENIYNRFVSFMKNNYDIQIESGVFGAMMDIHLVNDGPVTIIIEK